MKSLNKFPGLSCVGKDKIFAEEYPIEPCLSKADSTSGGDHVPDLDIAGAGELSQGQLHEVERTTNHDENHQVGDEEGPATILVSGVGEPPNITKANLGEGYS